MSKVLAIADERRVRPRQSQTHVRCWLDDKQWMAEHPELQGRSYCEVINILRKTFESVKGAA